MGFFTAFRESAYPTQPFAPLPRDADFSLRTAGALIWAAQLAYEVPASAKLTRIAANWGWTVSNSFQRSFRAPWRRAEAKGFVARAGAATVIAFAGTEPENLTQWQQDFTIIASGDGLHQGFKDGVAAAWNDLRRAALDTTDPIYLAGHSLGGAIAAAAALQLVSAAGVAPERFGGIYTAGMPRIARQSYAQTYEQTLGTRTFRFVYGDDVVPKVPPEFGIGFHHVGRWVAAPRHGTFAGTPTAAAPPTGNVLAGLFPDLNPPPYPGEHPEAVAAVRLLPPGLRDHLTDNYLRALRVLA